MEDKDINKTNETTGKTRSSESALNNLVMCGYTSIDDKFPPMCIGHNGYFEEHGHHPEYTADVIAITKDDGIVITYHDGDVWCYPHLSGCPQYEVTHWKLKSGDLDVIYDGRHCRPA